LVSSPFIKPRRFYAGNKEASKSRQSREALYIAKLMEPAATLAGSSAGCSPQILPFDSFI
jgi:hypothetical protein